MKVDVNAEIDNLADYVDRALALLSTAEEQLRAMKVLDSDDVEHDLNLASILDEFLAFSDSGQTLDSVFSRWSQEELTMVQRSEVVYALNLIKRQRLICKNIVRIARAELGLPDPDKDREMMELLMMQANPPPGTSAK